MDVADHRSFLDGLDAGDRAAIGAVGRTRTYSRGMPLFFEGDHSAEVIVIVAGQAKVVLTAKDGREMVLGIRSEGDLLGELSAIDGEPRSATVVALDDCEVLIVSRADFDRLIETRPGITRFLLGAMAARIRQTSARQLELGVDDALSRVCRRLVEMSERYGVTVDGSLEVNAPLSQQDMAAWSGLSRQAVVKALKALRSLGWVESSGGTFVVRDLAAVRERAEISGDL